MKKLVNYDYVDMTPEEEALRDQQEADAETTKATWGEKMATKEAKKASAKAKLKELGLDDDEIKALTGK